MANGSKNTISVRIGLDGGKTVERELTQIGEAGTAAFRALQKAADDVKTATTGMGASVSTLRERLVGVRDAMGGVARNFSFLGGEIARVGATILGALSISAIVNMTSAWADLTGRIRNVIPAGEDASEVMERLVDVANRTYQSVETTADAYATSARALQELGMNTQKSLDFFEALNNAMVVSGARGAQAESVMRALTRAMQDGSLRGANFQAVMDNGGRVLALLAKELNTNTAGLRNMAKQGLITADVIQRALLGNIKTLRDEADSMSLTILDGLTLVHNALLQWVGTTDDATGVSNKLAEGLKWVAENFDTVAKAAMSVVGAFLLVKGVRLALDILSLARALLMVIPAMVSLSVAMLASPWGLMAVGLTAAAVALLAMTGNLDGFVDTLKSTVASLLDFTNAAVDAGTDADKALKNVGASADDVGKGTQRASTAVRDLAKSTSEFASEGDDAAESAKKLGTEGKGAGTAIAKGMDDASPSVVRIADEADRATQSFVALADAAKSAAGAIAAAGAARSGSGGGGSGGAGGVPLRSGGRVVGPGTSTSDSIMAWLSNGEYVVKAKAVRRYGTRFLHAVNSMQLDLPRFANGGLISLPDVSGALALPRYADGGLVNPVTNIVTPDSGPTGRPLSLTIEGETFDGLIAPEDVASRLMQYATSRQLRRAGRTPSWYRG